MVEGLALGLLAPGEHVRLLSEREANIERGFNDHVVITSNDGLIKYSPLLDTLSQLRAFAEVYRVECI